MNHETIKQLALEAIFSIDELFADMALKGGNALRLVHNISERASIDLDISIRGDFEDDERVAGLLQTSLTRRFEPHDLDVIDFKFQPRPENISEEYKDFWGGWKMEFKLLPFEHRGATGNRRGTLAVSIAPSETRKFSVDFSRYEAVELAKEYELPSGLFCRAYPLDLIVIEKLRALCQQIPAYVRAMCLIFIGWRKRRGRLRFPSNTFAESSP